MYGTPIDGSFWAETYLGLVTILFTYIYVQYVGYIELSLSVSKTSSDN
jgi:hypothetical protein